MRSLAVRRQVMNLPQGDPRLLDTAPARRLLSSSIPARLAFVWTDGTPRVIPTWFTWTGEEIVMCTFMAGPGIRHPTRRVDVLRKNPDVAITIDTDDAVPHVLLIRGRAVVTEADGLVAEHVAAARRYLGEEASASFEAAARQPGTRTARIGVRPTWVGLIDFETRLPSPRGGVLPMVE
jgi:hypothetical protein